jgi:dTDP-4-dehydrorhamnose reductase
MSTSQQTHVVIGRGNVGLDLYELLTSKGHKVVIMTRSTGFSWPESLDQIKAHNPECVWVCAGAGSVESCKRDFDNAVSTHVTMPIGLVRGLPPQVKLVIFSSDYAANEDDGSNTEKINHNPRSLYAATKVWLEQAFKFHNRPNSCIVRIGTVYGKHLYDKTFPGKVHSRYPNPSSATFPVNWVCPTPSKWIADVLVRNYDRLFKTPAVTHHVAPKGGVTVTSWAKMILGEGYIIESKGFDQERPLSSNLGCSLETAPEWRDLWHSSWWN